MRIILVLLLLIAGCIYLLHQVLTDTRTRRLRILVQVLLAIFSTMLVYISLMALLQNS